jgi:hypothetical protein
MVLCFITRSPKMKNPNLFYSFESVFDLGNSKICFFDIYSFATNLVLVIKSSF